MNILRAHRAITTDQRGSVSVEFVTVFPLIMWFFMTIFETGFIATRMVLLEHGLDVASRSLRLGTDPTVDHDSFKENVCEHATILINCQRDLILEVVELDVDSVYPQSEANCIDRTGEIEPTIIFNPGGRNRIMFVRACMVIDPLFPLLGITLGLTKDGSGGLQIVSYTAFMNEPA